jgi:hypothetical protein
MAQRVESGCRDCKKCTNSGYANLGRNAGRLGVGVLTVGMSEAVMAGTKNCRICGHELSLHTGEDYVQRRAQPANPSSSAAAGWYPVEGGRQRYWDGQAWTIYAEEWTAEPAAAVESATPAIAPSSSADTLERLVSMHQAGHLSDEEFVAAKRSALGL